MEKHLDHAARHNILILFYERLQQSFMSECSLLLDCLGFSFSNDQKNEISRKVSAGRMRKESPQHVRKARHYKWIKKMSAEITMQTIDQTEDLLKELNYPLQNSKEQLPVWKSRKTIES